MIKKMFSFVVIFILYLFLNTQNSSAKEYCHLYEDNTLIETIELPFYFYDLTRENTNEKLMPTIEYSKVTTYIDSLTKCESIRKEIIYNYMIIETSNIINYSKEQTTLTNEELFNNSQFKKNGTIIKGLSTNTDEEPPIITGFNEYYTTNIDSPLKLELLLKTFSSYDNFDGNITHKIKIEYENYTNNIDKIGTYTIILSSSDEAKNKATITFYIQIIDTTPPIIEGENTYISYQSNPLNSDQIKNNLIAKDNTNNDLTSQIFVCEDLFTNSKNNVGIYSIYFCVYDASNNLSNPFKTTIEVKDDIPPTIEGLNIYDSYLSNPLTIEEITYSLAASDNHKDISDSIYITKDNYSNNQKTIGEKKIYFQAMDNYNNLSSPFIVTINVIDDVPPQIFGLNIYDSYLSSPLSLTYIKQQLTVIDNIDGNITSKIEIINDSYSSNLNNLGTFYITFIAKDSSLNYCEEFKVTINTIDDIPPYFIGPSSLTYKIEERPSIDIILFNYTCVDNTTKNLSFDILEENYSSSIDIGIFYIKLTCTDSSNNKSLPFMITIDLVEKLPITTSYILYSPTSTKLSIEEIAKLINLNNSYTIQLDTYTSNYSIEGSYNIEYLLDEETIINLNIKTFNDIQQNQSISKNTKKKKETFFTKIKRFFKNIISNIKKFFS